MIKPTQAEWVAKEMLRENLRRLGGEQSTVEEVWFHKMDKAARDRWRAMAEIAIRESRRHDDNRAWKADPL